MDTTLLVSLAGFALINSATPGPNNLLLVSCSTLFGWRKTVPLLAGIMLGFAIVLASAVLGLGTIVTKWPWLVMVVRIAGALWLAYMSLRFFAAALERVQHSDHKAQAALSRPLRFYEGVLFQWVNPKALILALSSAGAYFAIAETPLLRAVIIVGVFFLSGLVSCTSWMFAGEMLNRYMTNGRSARCINLIMGVLILLTAAHIILGADFS